MPTLTIATPAYNAAAFLPATIESVLRQTFTDFEYLIIDDGSTDATADVAKEYARKDPRIRVIHQDNRGIARTRNRALREAVTPFVAFLDHDDIALPERMGKQFKFLLYNLTVAAVGCRLQYIDSEGLPLHIYAPPSLPEEIRAFMRERRCPIPTTAMMVRREAALDAGGLNAAFEPIDDYEFLLRLSRRHDLSVIPEVLQKYSHVSGNTTHKSILAMFRGGMAAAYHARQGRYFPPTGQEIPRTATTRQSLQEAAVGQETLLWSDCFFCLTEHTLLSAQERSSEALFAVEQMLRYGCAFRRRVASRLIFKYKGIPLPQRLRWAIKVLLSSPTPAPGNPEDWTGQR